MIRVAVVDDQELVRSGFVVLLGSSPDIAVVGEAGDGPVPHLLEEGATGRGGQGAAHRGVPGQREPRAPRHDQPPELLGAGDHRVGVRLALPLVGVEQRRGRVPGERGGVGMALLHERDAGLQEVAVGVGRGGDEPQARHGGLAEARPERGDPAFLPLRVVDARELRALARVALAVQQADAYIRTGETGKKEKQLVDCILIDKSNADKYTLFELEE